jgi:hypothetical protein
MANSMKVLPFSRQASAKGGSQTSPIRKVRPLPFLPKGYLSYFTPRGNGIRIQCYMCLQTPPQSLSGYQRWKWLAMHEVVAHKKIKRAVNAPAVA